MRTVIDLRNDDELGADLAPRPAGLTTLHLPLDGVEDTEFWKDWHGRPEFGTPIYYRPFLDHFPERTAAVFTAIARAEPGGVVVHCGIGRDRTGLITLMLLALAGAGIDDITADYALSEPRVPFGGVGDVLRGHTGITPAEVIAALLAELDVEAYLRAAGVSERGPRRDPGAAAQPLSGPAAWRRRASAHGSSSASRRSGSKENGGASSPAAASRSRSDAPASGPGRSAPSSAPRRMSKLGSRSSSATTTNAEALW